VTTGGAAAPGSGGDRRVVVAIVVIALLAAALGSYLIVGPDVAEPEAPVAAASAGPSRSPVPSAPPSPEPTPTTTAGRILQRAERNADGSVSVEVSERETTTLVAAGLARNGAPAIDDLQVDLVAAAEGAAGTMVLVGELADQGLPVTATVDLAVLDGQILPRVRDVRVGPLPITGVVREDLNAELESRGGLIDVGLTIEELRTTEQQLVVRGRDR
jgi:hypothetical protein